MEQQMNQMNERFNSILDQMSNMMTQIKEINHKQDQGNSTPIQTHLAYTPTSSPVATNRPIEHSINICNNLNQHHLTAQHNYRPMKKMNIEIPKLTNKKFASEWLSKYEQFSESEGLNDAERLQYLGTALCNFEGIHSKYRSMNIRTWRAFRTEFCEWFAVDNIGEIFGTARQELNESVVDFIFRMELKNNKIVKVKSP